MFNKAGWQNETNFKLKTKLFYQNMSWKHFEHVEVTFNKLFGFIEQLTRVNMIDPTTLTRCVFTFDWLNMNKSAQVSSILSSAVK